MADLIGMSAGSNVGPRRPMAARLKADEIRLFTLISDTLFQSKLGTAIETALVTLAIREGVTKMKWNPEEAPMPTADRLKCKADVVAALEELRTYAAIIAERCKYLVMQGRLAYVVSENLLELAAAVEAFPHPHTARRRHIPSPECEAKPLAFTMRVDHLKLSDEVGAKLLNKKKRGRREIWERAMYDYATALSMTPDSPYPTFPTYPRTELLRLHLYYDRYVLAVIDALSLLGKAVLAHGVEPAAYGRLLETVYTLNLMMTHGHPPPPDRDMPLIESILVP